MNTWMVLIGVSSLIGSLCGVSINNKFAVYFAAAIPWSIFLVVILYDEYFISLQANDVSFWPVAILFGGSVAAFTGFVVCKIVRFIMYFRAKSKAN